MKCPFCESLSLLVLDSRHHFNKNIVRRRRSCNICKKRFTTIEQITIEEKPQKPLELPKYRYKPKKLKVKP